MPIMITENVYLIVWKVGMTSIDQKMKSCHEALMEEFSKNIETMKQSSIMCCLEQLLKYPSLATLDNAFWEFCESQNTLLSKKFVYKTITKENSKLYYNAVYVVFKHGQVELYGTWLLEVAQHQLVSRGS